MWHSAAKSEMTGVKISRRNPIPVLLHYSPPFLLLWVSFIFFQLEGAYLVEIFCEVEMDAYERAVGESFSNLAFEAVEKIISVSCK